MAQLHHPFEKHLYQLSDLRDETLKPSRLCITFYQLEYQNLLR